MPKTVYVIFSLVCMCCVYMHLSVPTMLRVCIFCMRVFILKCLTVYVCAVERLIIFNLFFSYYYRF